MLGQYHLCSVRFSRTNGKRCYLEKVSLLRKGCWCVYFLMFLSSFCFVCFKSKFCHILCYARFMRLRQIAIWTGNFQLQVMSSFMSLYDLSLFTTNFKKDVMRDAVLWALSIKVSTCVCSFDNTLCRRWSRRQGVS